MLYLLLLFPLFLYYHFTLKKIKDAKYKNYCKEKEVEIVYPRISIIIYCFSDNIENTVKSINYIRDKYDIIPVKTLNNLENIINKNSKFTLIISNNMILTTDCIYDMIKFVIHNDLDSTHCLFSFPNYKDNFINNIYYHHRYLENMIDDNPIFGRLISSKEIKNFGKSKIKSDLLQKNLIVQNLPEILSIPREIYFYDIHKINKFYLIEYFSFLIIFLNINISYILSFISIVFYYYYQASYINYGINDFNFHGSFFLSMFKILSLPFTLLNFITFNYFTIKYPKLKFNSFIKPQYSDKVEFKYGFYYHLTNYNLDIVYLNGTHYQMGYTIGEMYKKELNESIKLLDNYVANFLINPLWKNIGYKARDILEVVKEFIIKYVIKPNC